MAGAEIDPEIARVLAIRDPDALLHAADAWLDTHPGTGEAVLALDENGRVRTECPRLVLLDAMGHDADHIGRKRLTKWSIAFASAADVPEERIVGIRNAMWASRDSAGMAAPELRKLLENAEPLAAPTMAQVFDGIVYLADATFVPDLAAAMQKPALEVIAAQTLDRLAAGKPLAVMRELNSNPDLLADRPLLRADFFAKADVAREEERGEFEQYLLRADVPFEAKEKSILGLAQTGRVLTVGLFTGVPGDPKPADRAHMVSVLREWTKDEKFAHFHTVIGETVEWLVPDSRSIRDNGR